ncbi:MAG: bifunctional oligoribonuclease/PAP phosphatase NrnA [Clostridiales bacterium]|nr:bifunctional oligoribonuclease/PAP phosphatase NrnA [Candidatus Equinaster intestinalis]
MENNCNQLKLGEVCRYLKKHNDYIILTHVSPDGDTLGSAYALALALVSMGKRAFVVCSDEIPAKYDYFIKQANLKSFDYKTIVAVDVADAKLLGSLYEDYSEKIELAIDHHISNTRYAKNLYLDASASATAECIYEIIRKMRVKITPLMATALYTGIITDTGCFKYSNVTPKTHKIAAELFGFGIDAADISRRMFDTKSKACMELEKMVLAGAKYLFDDRCMMLTVTLDMQEKSQCRPSDLEVIAPISRSVEGVKIGITVKETERDVYKISLRTYEPFDASAIAQKLGGGGHKAAAGCTVKGDLDTVCNKIENAVGEAIAEYDKGTDISK